MKRFLLKSAAFLALYVLASLLAYSLAEVMPLGTFPAHFTGWWGATAFIYLWPGLFGLVRRRDGAQ